MNIDRVEREPCTGSTHLRSSKMRDPFPYRAGKVRLTSPGWLNNVYYNNYEPREDEEEPES